MNLISKIVIPLFVLFIVKSLQFSRFSNGDCAIKFSGKSKLNILTSIFKILFLDIF